MKYLLLTALLMTACGPPQGTPVKEILSDVDFYYGKTITIRSQFVSGARCRQGDDGEWHTYCKDCQWCKGPMVVDAVRSAFPRVGIPPANECHGEEPPDQSPHLRLPPHCHEDLSGYESIIQCSYIGPQLVRIHETANRVSHRKQGILESC